MSQQGEYPQGEYLARRQNTEKGKAMAGIVMREAPFDAVASVYDQDFTGRLLGQWLRDAVREELGRVFQPGERILELGCGTGEDAIWLARRGALVTATDVSQAMLAIAQRKADTAGISDPASMPGQTSMPGHITWQLWDLAKAGQEVPSRPFSGLYRGAFANFGVLNCLPDRRILAQTLAGEIQPGGRLVVVMMGPFCPWEILWYLIHGQLGTAFRRFRGHVLAHAGGGAWLPVWYPSPGKVKQEFAPWFRAIGQWGVGVCLPPSYLAHLVERWPALFTRLRMLEQRVADTRWAAWANDHYMIEFERVD
ncbi:MAG: methyltransferase domain-containing protein [Chloroflexi bacterium]|nr:methyltransferase domain-containing protein [Chloroflexota bacterium]